MSDPARLEGARRLASPLAAYLPWEAPSGASPQRAFHGSDARVRVYRGGNRTGKTTALVIEALLRCVGWHRRARHRPPVHGWLSALDWEHGVGQVLWREMRKWLPWGEVIPGGIVWYRRGEPALPSAIPFVNGSLLEFKTAKSGRDSYQGAGLQFAGVDEEHPPDVVEELRARLLGAPGGDLLVTATPVRRERWLLDLEREPGTHVVRASMRDAAAAGLLDSTAVDQYLASLPERQRRVRELGDFAALEGLVYPEFDRVTHGLVPAGDRYEAADGARYPRPLPAIWPRYGAIDFGYSVPTAVAIAALAPDGALLVETVYYEAWRRASEWGRLLRGALPRLEALVADHDANERAELEAAGVDTMPARKDDREAGIEAVARRLHPVGGRPSLYLVLDEARRHPLLGRCDAERLAWELEAYRYHDRREHGADPRDEPIKRDDHACDALRYLVVEVEAGRGGPPDLGRLLAAPAPDGAPRGVELAPPAGWLASVAPPR